MHAGGCARSWKFRRVQRYLSAVLSHEGWAARGELAQPGCDGNGATGYDRDLPGEQQAADHLRERRWWVPAEYSGPGDSQAAEAAGKVLHPEQWYLCIDHRSTAEPL